MRFLTSRPFVVGLVLVLGAIASMPLFVTELAEKTCTEASPTNPSWDCTHLMAVDFRIPVLIAASGFALMLVTVVRLKRVGGSRQPSQD
jgi:hypothetical protein